MVKNSGKKKAWKVFLIIFIIIVSITFAAYYMIYSKLSKINTTKIDDSPKALSINEEMFKAPEKNEKDFVNILLLGTDLDTEVNNKNSSDSIIIATIDKKHSKVKLTSLMRDSLVDIEGHGDGKLKYAYSYGGPQLAIKTVNQSYDMNIKDYVKVNFYDFEKIVDALGGIEINVTKDELTDLNNALKGNAIKENKKYIPVQKSGLQILNGFQTLQFSRLRHIGTTEEFGRQERHRTILTAILKKISQKGILELPKVSNEILPYVETNLDKGEMIALGSFLVTNKITTPEQLRLPTDDNFQPYWRDNLYYMKWDKDPTVKKLHKFIYEVE